MIDGLLAGGRTGVSNRQIMVLRFWNKEPLAKQGREAVSEWMDEWYDEDPARLEAWELWKRENSDKGRQSDPKVVPVSVGSRYLKRVASSSGSDPDQGSCMSMLWGVAILGAAAWLAYKYLL